MKKVRLGLESGFTYKGDWVKSKPKVGDRFLHKKNNIIITYIGEDVDGDYWAYGSIEDMEYNKESYYTKLNKEEALENLSKYGVVEFYSYIEKGYEITHYMPFEIDRYYIKLNKIVDNKLSRTIINKRDIHLEEGGYIYVKGDL